MNGLIKEIKEVRKVFFFDFLSAVWYDPDKEVKDRSCLLLIETGNLPCLRKIIDIIDIIKGSEAVSLFAFFKPVGVSVSLEWFFQGNILPSLKIGNEVA